MSANELGHYAAYHIGKVKARFLPGHLGMKDHLQQQVTQLFLQVFHVTPFYGICHLIGFFEGMRGYGAEVLLQIPGAAAIRVAKLRHDCQEGVNAGGVCWNLHGDFLNGLRWLIAKGGLSQIFAGSAKASLIKLWQGLHKS